MDRKDYHLGIDLGSVSLKVVLLNSKNEILFERWVRVSGDPLTAVSRVLLELNSEHPEKNISSIGVTGSGRGLIAGAIEAKLVNEISAHAAAASKLYSNVRTIIEIGGQDSKLVILNDTGDIKDFRMNELCAAGTGAFLDQQAARLNIGISEFAKLADNSTDPVPIAGRCAVFAKTDMTHHQQEGRPLPDIVAGLNEALVRSYISNLVRGKELPRPIAFQGGVASNPGLVRAFKKILNLQDEDLFVPKNHLTMGAIGASLISKNNLSLKTVRIDELVDKISTHVCTDGTATDKEAKILKKCLVKSLPPDFKVLNLNDNYLGIDVGSVSVKLALIGGEGLIYSDYRFSDGKPLDLLKTMLSGMNSKINSCSIGGVGITGSGRNFIGKLLRTDVILNEITAQIRAAKFIMPDADTIIEIGGQDAKFMRIENGHASHFEMNRVCAAGTGAFLQEQSDRLKLDLKKDFADHAFSSKRPADLGSRCTVFMESDIVSHQQMGFSKPDLVAGLSHSVITNYLEKVVSGSPIGDKILFLGGVAENRAIVSALEAQLSKTINTSTVGTLSGAIGAALTAHDERCAVKFIESKFLASADSLKFEQFHCEDCPNSCLITRESSQDGVTIGGRCGKWDSATKPKKLGHTSYIKKRTDLLGLKEILHHAECTAQNAPRIGIPRALLAFDRLPSWRTFFKELGCKVVLSPPTDTELLETGTKRLAVETCLPIKAFCAHIEWLQRSGEVDYLFIPSIIYSSKDKHNRDTSQCPYVQAARQFANNVATMPILNPVISWKWHPNDEERSMVEVAKTLRFSKKVARGAWNTACSVQDNFRKELLSMGDEVLRSLNDGTLNRAFVLLGKDYNVCDSRLNSNIVKTFEAFGETLITQDMLTDDSGNYTPTFKSMLWTHGKEIIAASEIASRIDHLYPVMITNFGCGPDSFTTKFAQDSASNKPFLTLEVDEHSSSVGMETRIEAFLDSLPERESLLEQKQTKTPAIKESIKKIYLPNFSDHGFAFAATFRSLGFEAVLTDLPDDESLQLGSKHSTSGECHPYTLMLGDYIKVAKSGDDFSNSCYFMPDSGLCRVGQFGNQMRLVAEKENLKLPINTNIEEILSLNPESKTASRTGAALVYWEMMRGMDFLSQKFFETRAYEVNAGDSDRVRANCRKMMMDFINDNRPHDGLKNAITLLDTVKTDRSKPKFKIGITGDYYTRICDYANSDIFRDIERLGGVVMLPPTMCEFVKYDSHQKPVWAFNHKNPSAFMQQMLARVVVKRKEKKIRKLFGDGIDYQIPLEYRRAIERLKPYMDEKLPSGMTSSVAAILEQIHSGADGILNLITFHCTYGLILGSTLASIDKDHPDIPKLTLIFEGIKPNHNKLRLEAFMERIKCRPKSRP
ncbi:MAG: hypothetical protein HN337_03670 [Deltaproteobacteria bacterium]|nr:hypothetical protein [Deltaproteobacteria bacterium]